MEERLSDPFENVEVDIVVVRRLQLRMREIEQTRLGSYILF